MFIYIGVTFLRLLRRSLCVYSGLFQADEVTGTGLVFEEQDKWPLPLENKQRKNLEFKANAVNFESGAPCHHQTFERKL